MLSRKHFEVRLNDPAHAAEPGRLGELFEREFSLPPAIPERFHRDIKADLMAEFETVSDSFGWGVNAHSGYSPACDNEWRPGICHKPKVKCAECLYQRFPPLDERAVEAHLRGTHTLGIYAIGTDDTCRFLAADFDGEGWRDDVLAYREAAERVGVMVAIERSRSGNGAHAWMFFAEPVQAATARRLGTILIAKASALRPTLGLGAYDRLFPNQDMLPAGGFGNLIALPLAKVPRQQGNTLFVDTQMEAFDDQWSYLAQIPRLSREGLERILAKIAPLLPLTPLSQSGSAIDHDFALQTDAAVLDLSQWGALCSTRRGENSNGVCIDRTCPHLRPRLGSPGGVAGSMEGDSNAVPRIETKRDRRLAWPIPTTHSATGHSDAAVAEPRRRHGGGAGRIRNRDRR
jgi:hypothetical protein